MVPSMMMDAGVSVCVCVSLISTINEICAVLLSFPVSGTLTLSRGSVENSEARFNSGCLSCLRSILKTFSQLSFSDDWAMTRPIRGKR